ncbi:type II secretion system minor pseudopilin GspK [uncultured Algimonas sp.]|uniref:type II secretion system minor pseudopilin GspK n=1 Tax=uncultured Algimonas sp. TaxID=1547920 RepID=UPI002602EC47|nr:type II secretion system minor pseudopilin GspK [uncultured Algimonas sp.]
MCSRSAPPSREDGTVLLSTLLVLSLMSAVALALLATLRSSVTRTAELDAAAQADLYARGAADFVRSQIDAVSQVDGAALGARLAVTEPVILPFENGLISVAVSDGSHCFRLSGLVDSSGVGSDTARQQFEALMLALGTDPVQAARVAGAAVDWIDADSQLSANGAEDGIYMSRTDLPHRTANVPMQSVTELRALEGMGEILFRTLLPHVCIGEDGVPTRFNIDTAEPRHAPVLAVILGGGREAERVALELIQSRPSGGYGSRDALNAAPVLDGYENKAARLGDIVYTPQRIVAETTVRFGPVERAQLLAYEGLDKPPPRLTYRAWGREEFPSLIRADQPAEEPPR